jgi:chemotaxis response regulator CheB
LNAKAADPEGSAAFLLPPSLRDEVQRPSINVFFRSVARHWERAATGVLPTGMGRGSSNFTNR